MTPAERRALLLTVTLGALAEGKGSLTQQRAYQELEWRKCERDVVYWAERYAYIVHAGRIIKWHLWPIQKQILRDLQNGIPIVGVKARQLGVTSTVALYALWDCIFHDATVWDNLSSSEEKAKDILKRVQATKDRLPNWMVERASKRAGLNLDNKKRDKGDSIKRISFGLSEMKIATSTVKSVQGASNNINLDEATLHSDLKRKLQHMFATLEGGGGIGAVIANGNGEDDFFWFYQAAKRGDNGFKPYFFWWGDAPYRLNGAILTTREGKKLPAQKFSRDELLAAMNSGRLDSPWYKTMEKRFLMKHPEADIFAFKAIYPSNEQEAFYISANSRFSLAIVNQLMDEIRLKREKDELPVQYGDLELGRDGYEVIPRTNGAWRVFMEPRPGHKYVAGIDSAAGGNAGDYSAIEMLELLEDGAARQVAVYQARVEPPVLAYEAIKAAKWYNDAYLVPEANYTGGLLIDHIKAEYWNVYMRKQRLDKAYISFPISNLGFWTDSNTKPKLIGNLATALARGDIEFFDSKTLDELGHYEIKDDGLRTGAPKGMTDDLVMALALAYEGVMDIEIYHVNQKPRELAIWEE